MKRFGTFLLFLCAACGSSAARAPAPAPRTADALAPAARVQPTATPDVDKLMKREAPQPDQGYRVSLLRGQLTATIHAVAPPKVKTGSDDDGDLYTTLHVDLGGE